MQPKANEYAESDQKPSTEGKEEKEELWRHLKETQTRAGDRDKERGRKEGVNVH